MTLPKIGTAGIDASGVAALRKSQLLPATTVLGEKIEDPLFGANWPKLCHALP